ncbi:MAG: GlxA family transcriptional regulator [Pseudomonadota bacterium]
MDYDSFVPRGAASLRVEYRGPPKDYYFVLLPKLTLLAFTSALEPLRVANQVSGKALYRWFVMTEGGTPVECSCGVHITPDSELRALPKNAQVFVCAGIEPHLTSSARITQWLARQAAHGAHPGGICTGAFALAGAGLLSDRRFTLHWENQPAFREIYPGHEPTGHLYEIDDTLLTCGGGSAASDMMLELIERDHGPALAGIVADMCLHRRAGHGDVPQRPAYAAALGSRKPQLIAATEVMANHLEEPLDISVVAEHAGLSRRQMERHFRRYLSVTPAQYYLDLRISRAHALLNETALSIAEIAAACGFASSAQLAQHFRARYGETPRRYRAGGGSAV